MGDPKTVLEGCVKYRDKKKWKARWAVVSKLSPVADCLHLQLYRDSKERCKNGPTKASLSLEAFLGMETGFTLDKESNTMALICSELVVVLAFDSRELLIQWQVKIKANLPEEQQFLVQIAHVPPKSKLPCGPARLHLQDYTFCLVSGVPPRLLASWPIKELRRFGVVEGKFCFEGGSLCGKGEGLHVLLTNQSEEMMQAMDLASKGKLLGKRKTLSRKNSVLETSSRTPLHKSVRHNSMKSSTNDSSRPLLSSGSESSTCDACSEILRSSDALTVCEELNYNSASSTKTSCRIHYRWPSCMSRWGQSSTVTSSDVESMDTVSVTLSDYQGPSHSGVNSKPNSQGASLLCLCESQGTWPFNHCMKCGREFYSRSSLGHPNGGRHHQRPLSPEAHDAEGPNGFSPQWTMNAALPSPSSEGNGPNPKKESYQLMLPSSDRASLCSHTSRSSSTSTASSSGSEYSVPRNYLDALYDKPRTLHGIRNGASFNKKNGIHNGSMLHLAQSTSSDRSPASGLLQPDRGIVCPCHDPISDWAIANEEQTKPVCSCWNQLSLSVHGENDVRGPTVVSSSRSSGANPSPPSPKRGQNSSSATRTVPLVSVTQPLTCNCKRQPSNQYMHYAVPKAALANMYLKENKAFSGKPGETTHITENPLTPNLSEDYDVPRKFVDILTTSDLVLKSSLKALENGSPCSCKNMKMPFLQNSMQPSADAKLYNHRYDPPASDNMQMCTCQRLVLWAGSFVPCLGGSSSNTTDHGWQCGKGIGYPSKNARAIPNHYGTICCEPSRTAELVLVNEKPKHILYNKHIKEQNSVNESHLGKSDKAPSGGTSSKPETLNSSDDFSCTYVNIEFPEQSSTTTEKSLISESSSAVNYANLDFAQTLSLYENSNSVLTKLEHQECVTSSPEKPPLPPRGQFLLVKKSEFQKQTDEISKINFQMHSEQKPVEIKPHNGSAYELMSFEKQSSYDDDYLMMQPVYHEKVDRKSERKTVPLPSEEVKSLHEQKEDTEDSYELPLRPFMPFAYPQFDSNEEEIASSDVKYPHASTGDAMTRRYHLINEDIELRSTRSNSLSELKKIVLLRKRSSSVDGKNSISSLDHGIKSYPASPVCSPRPSMQRKNSLFSKLNLRSKEKSMSTNEIIPPAILPSNANPLNGYRRNNLHRSADCLKLNEEYANSDDDISNDNSEVSLKETVAMKRSSSVPCRSALPVNLPSPRKTTVPAIPELNDLNKETKSASDRSDPPEEEFSQPKYSLEGDDSSKKSLYQGLKSYCDNTFNQTCFSEQPSGKNEVQGAPQRNPSQTLPMDNSSILDPYKSTTSSSSSDISDFIESLSRCSRSSSSSSGSSSSDYIRTEDTSHKKCAKFSNTKTTVNPSVSLPKTSNLSSMKVEDCHASSYPCVPHCSHISEYSDSRNYESCSSFSSLRNQNASTRQFPTSNALNSNVQPTKASDPVAIPNSSHPSTSSVSNNPAFNGRRTRTLSRSPTSSTSSLSTSPSITDYSSSSSGNCSLPVITVSGVNKDCNLKREANSAGNPLTKGNSCARTRECTRNAESQFNEVPDGDGCEGGTCNCSTHAEA